MTTAEKLETVFAPKKPMVNIQNALKIDGWMEPCELEWLAFEASRHEVVVEVGSYLGRSARAMGGNKHSGVLYCVDHFDGPVEVDPLPVDREAIFELFNHNLRDLIDSGRVKPWMGKSVEVAQEWQRHGLKADMVFIDASHDHKSVTDDIREWAKVLKPGGLLCGHDANWAGVEEARRMMLPPHMVMNTVGSLWALDNFRGL